MSRRLHLLVLSFAVARFMASAEPTLRITVETDRPGAKINPRMWGVFFEDINFAADGGLYAELVKNRSFEFPDPRMGWKEIKGQDVVGTLEVLDQEPISAVQPHYLRVNAQDPGDGVGVENEGFRGMGIRAGVTYNFSVAARGVEGDPTLRIVLLGHDRRELASARISGISTGWKRYTARLRAAKESSKASLKVLLEKPGVVDLDLVSLFPDDTWKNRPNGLRADLVQLLADLKPGFIRFPGGCIVEGRDLANRYQWKNTIGDPAERRLMVNRWNAEFKDRAAPDYYQSFGLGFFEFFQLCEDLETEPLPILNCGMACQFNSGQLASPEELDSYVHDALDLIEFANGPTTGFWGAKRAELGHPEPFKLKLLGIGNEQWGPAYVERFARFAQALKSRHPEIQLIASAGPDPAGERFDFLWPRLLELKADFVDEHFYRPPEWFLANGRRYDGYSRTGPKVFAGEYAALVPNRANNLQSALAEAAMMTGFERNADVVRMACYAPLMAHIEAWQWRPNLIWFDNLKVVATPDYHVQKLFSRNRGDVVLPIVLKDLAPALGGLPRCFASASGDPGTGEIILKIVNVSPEPIYASVLLKGVARSRAKGIETVLTADSLKSENLFKDTKRVAPRTRDIKVNVPGFNHSLEPFSLTLLRVRIKDG
jgi:alpha-N-arabinofuranosidase